MKKFMKMRTVGKRRGNTREEGTTTFTQRHARGDWDGMRRNTYPQFGKIGQKLRDVGIPPPVEIDQGPFGLLAGIMIGIDNLAQLLGQFFKGRERWGEPITIRRHERGTEGLSDR